MYMYMCVYIYIYIHMYITILVPGTSIKDFHVLFMNAHVSTLVFAC